MKIISFAFKALILGGLYVVVTQNSDRLAPLVSQAVASVRSHASAYLKPDLTASGVNTFGGWWDCRQQMGNPTRIANGVAQADPRWQSDHLANVPLPWKGHAAWNPKLPVRSLQVHQDTAASLERALTKIWLDAGQSQLEIDRLGLSAIGGGYMWRQVREGVALSAHAYGCAIDFDPSRNAPGNRAANLAKPENHYVVRDLKAEGWVWGGDFPRPDAMHFQATALATAPARALVTATDLTIKPADSVKTDGAAPIRSALEASLALANRLGAWALSGVERRFGNGVPDEASKSKLSGFAAGGAP